MCVCFNDGSKAGLGISTQYLERMFQLQQPSTKKHRNFSCKAISCLPLLFVSRSRKRWLHSPQQFFHLTLTECVAAASAHTVCGVVKLNVVYCPHRVSSSVVAFTWWLSHEELYWYQCHCKGAGIGTSIVVFKKKWYPTLIQTYQMLSIFSMLEEIFIEITRLC